MRAAQPLFDDARPYFYSELPNHGVKLPAVGVRIRVLEERPGSGSPDRLGAVIISLSAH